MALTKTGKCLTVVPELGDQIFPESSNNTTHQREQHGCRHSLTQAMDQLGSPRDVNQGMPKTVVVRQGCSGETTFHSGKSTTVCKRSTCAL